MQTTQCGDRRSHSDRSCCNPDPPPHPAASVRLAYRVDFNRGGKSGEFAPRHLQAGLQFEDDGKAFVCKDVQTKAAGAAFSPNLYAFAPNNVFSRAKRNGLSYQSQP